MLKNAPTRALIVVNIGIWSIGILAIIVVLLFPGWRMESPATALVSQVQQPTATISILTDTSQPTSRTAHSLPPPVTSPLAPSSTALATPIAASGPTASVVTDPVSLPDLLHRVDATVAALRTGEFEAVIAYVGNTRSTVQVQFNIDDARQVMSLHVTTRYQAVTGMRTDERLLVNEDSWQRQGDSWTSVAEAAGLREQFPIYLPHPSAGTGMTAQLSGEDVVLQYYDPALDADTILLVDRTTGQPRTIRQDALQSGTVTTVIYSGWNTPTPIVPPSGARISSARPWLPGWTALCATTSSLLDYVRSTAL